MKTKTDVLIVGGGVIGACCALYLARAGRQVTLIERGELCAGASRGNACWVAVAYALPTAAPGVLGQGLKWMFDAGSPFYIKPRLNVELVRWLLAFRAACTHNKMMAGAKPLLSLNRGGLALFRELNAESSFDFGYHETGLLHLHLSEKYRAAGEREAELLRSIGVRAISMERDELAALEPKIQGDVLSGVFFPEHAHLDPVAFVEGVAAQAEAAGATILTQTAVTGFEKAGNQIRAVETANGRFEPQEVVLAAGAWSSILAKQLGSPILMEPAKGYSVTVRKNSAEQGPTRSLAVDDAKVAITPLGSNRFRFSSTLELAGFDPSINQKRLDVNRSALERVLPNMETLDAEAPWSGYRPLTPDGLPYIGRSQKIPNLIFATGHGMLGVTQAPITGKLVTEIINGQSTSIDLTSFQPERY